MDYQAEWERVHSVLFNYFQCGGVLYEEVMPDLLGRPLIEGVPAIAKKYLDLKKRVGLVGTPTDAQVEALARVLRAAPDKWWPALDGTWDQVKDMYLDQARAAYTHIGRVPVGWELDVTADEIASVIENHPLGRAPIDVLDLCRSRIKPVYECKECANKEAEIDRVRNWNVNLNTTVEAVRAALENGGNE